MPLFDARILNPLVRYLDRHGVNSDSYLSERRIPRETLLAGGWIAKKQAYDLIRDVVTREHCPEIVFEAYEDFCFDDLGPIAIAVSSCRTVKEALEVTTRLGGSAFEGNEYFLQIEGKTAWLSYRERKHISEGQDWINDMTLAAYRRMINLLVDPEWLPEKVLIQGAGSSRHVLVDQFNQCQLVSRTGVTALGFPTSFLRRRVQFSSAPLNQTRCNEWRDGITTTGSFSDAIGRLIESRFQYTEIPTLREVSRMTSLSSATIKRRLSEEGLGYQDLIDRLRFEMASKMLIENERSIKEIAIELGYSGCNSFVRAFRRMTATTPGELRRKHLNGYPENAG
ncbi:MAG: AraC family transcriptional regulator [bacterium]|nr:AraC family transcriptional regulator [bacterium]